jgi:hypothetical protein
MLYAPCLLKAAARVIVGVNNLKASSLIPRTAGRLRSKLKLLMFFVYDFMIVGKPIVRFLVDGTLLWMEACCNIPSSLEDNVLLSVGLESLPPFQKNFIQLSTKFCLFDVPPYLPSFVPMLNRVYLEQNAGKKQDPMHSQELLE